MNRLGGGIQRGGIITHMLEPGHVRFVQPVKYLPRTSHTPLHVCGRGVTQKPPPFFLLKKKLFFISHHRGYLQEGPGRIADYYREIRVKSFLKSEGKKSYFLWSIRKEREGPQSTMIPCLQLGGAPFQAGLIEVFLIWSLGQKKEGRGLQLKLLGVCHKRNKNRGGGRPPKNF